MAYYPAATAEQIAFFAKHGWLVVEDAIPDAMLDEIEQRCERIIDEKEDLANDWAWSADEAEDKKSFRIIQSSPSFVWKDIAEAPYRRWVVDFARDLFGRDMEFWYDQYLAKPPGNNAATNWHQDEGYWGRDLDNKGLTCWIPLQDVDVTNGCMHFIDGAHREGILTHRQVEGVQSDLLVCDVDERRTLPVPIRRGSVTFHHSKMPHMTTPNVSQGWRKAVTNHVKATGIRGEGDHYPWKRPPGKKFDENLAKMRQ